MNVVFESIPLSPHRQKPPWRTWNIGRYRWAVKVHNCPRKLNLGSAIMAIDNRTKFWLWIDVL